MANWKPQYRGTDILQATDLQAIVNPVNCSGIMGKGLALQFAETYPEIVRPYQDACKSQSLAPGRVQLQFLDYSEFKTTHYPLCIVNFPTKRHWRDRSITGDIENGLRDMYRQLHEQGIESVGVPSLGAGLGGLKWDIVRSLIVYEAFRYKHIHTVLFAPHYSREAGYGINRQNINKVWRETKRDLRSASQ